MRRKKYTIRVLYDAFGITQPCIVHTYLTIHRRSYFSEKRKASSRIF